MVRIIYHRQKCIGCNACVEANPDRWRISRRDGRCTLVGATEKRGVFTVLTSYDELEKNQAAAVHCPAKIIQIEEL